MGFNRRTFFQAMAAVGLSGPLSVGDAKTAEVQGVGLDQECKADSIRRCPTLECKALGIKLELIALSSPATRAAIDVVTTEGPGFRQFIPAVIECSEITFDVLFDESSSNVPDQIHNALSSNVETWAIEFNTEDEAEFHCDGLISAVGVAIPFDGKMIQPITVRFTGRPTYSAYE